MPVRVQQEDFDAGAEIARLRANNPKIGAVASFIGIVRDLNEGAAVGSITLEHYPGMTDKALTSIAEQAKARWNLLDVLIIHRIGTLAPTDQIVLKSCIVLPTPARYQAPEQTVEHHCEEVVDEWGIPVEQQAAAQRAIVRHQLVGPAVCERRRCRSKGDRQSAVERGDAPIQCYVVHDQTDHCPGKP